MATNYEIGQTFTPDDLRDMALQVAEHYDIPKDLFLGLNAHESSWNPAAKNPKSSARGLGQFIDGTAKSYFDEPITNDEHDPRNHPGKSLDASARYLKDLYGQHGDWEKAVLHYGENTPAYLNKIKEAAGREADEYEHFKQGQFMEAAGGADLGFGMSPVALESPGINPSSILSGITNTQGDNCGDALAKYLNSTHGFNLPRGGIGPGEVKELGYAKGAAVYSKGNLSMEALTPGTIIHMTRQPGDRNYEYGSTHIGIIDQEGDNTVFRSYTAGKGWRAEQVNQNFIDRLPNQIIATNPISPGAIQQDQFMEVAGGADIGFGMSPVGQEAQPGALYQGIREYLGLNKEPWKMTPVMQDIAAEYMKTPATYPGMTQDEQEAADLALSIGQGAPLGLSGEDLLFPGQRQKDIVESETHRIMGRYVDGYTASLTEGAKKAAVGETFMPETALGSAIGQGAYLAGQIMGPFKLIKMLTGSYLFPTAEGLRTTSQILTAGMKEGAVNLGLLQGLSRVVPAMIEHDDFSKWAGSVLSDAKGGALVGAAFPLLSLVPGQGAVGAGLRMATGFAAMDYMRAGRGKWTTLGDFYQAFQTWDEESKKQFASLSYSYLVDLYFANSVRPIRETMAAYNQNQILQEMAKLKPQELEKDILAVTGQQPPDALTELWKNRGAAGRLEQKVEAGQPIGEPELKQAQAQREGVQRETAAVQEEIGRLVDAGETVPPELWSRYRTLNELAQVSTGGETAPGEARGERGPVTVETPQTVKDINPDVAASVEVAAPTAGAAGPRRTVLSSPAPAAPESVLPPGVREFQQRFGTARGGRPEAALTTLGSETTMRTERGMAVQGRWGVFEAGDLVTSHDTALNENPEFPRELQPRERGRAASQLQVGRIRTQLQPEFLGESPKASEGAPIVGKDLVVESGNGRTIALKGAYDAGEPKAQEYRKWLVDNADRFGLDAKQLEGMKAPVLVRVRQTEVDRPAFVRQANEAAVAGLSAVEQAKADAAKLMGSDILSRFIPNDRGLIVSRENQAFIRRFMEEAVGPNELTRYVTREGEISQEGINRVRNALFAAAYGDSTSLEKLAESPEDLTRNVTGALTITAPRAASLNQRIGKGELHDLSLSKNIADAAQILQGLRESGQPVKDYLAQQKLFTQDDPLTADLLKFFDSFKLSRVKIAEVLNRYYDLVEALGNPKQKKLVGLTEIPKLQDVLQTAIERMEAKHGKGREALQADLFQGEPGGGEKAAPAPGSEGTKRPAEAVNPAEQPQPYKLYAGFPGPETGEVLARLKEGTREARSLWADLKTNIREIVAPGTLPGAKEVAKGLITMMGRKNEAINQAHFRLLEFRDLFQKTMVSEWGKLAATWQAGKKTGTDLDRAWEVYHEISDALVPRVQDYRTLAYQENYLRQAWRNARDPEFKANIGEFLEGKPFKNYLDLDESGNPRLYKGTFAEDGSFTLERQEGVGEPAKTPEERPKPLTSVPRGRTLTGGRGYFKEKKIPDWQTGLMLGGIPKFKNLFDLMVWDLGEKNQFVWGNTFIKWAREEGYLKYVTTREIPQGWARINDPRGLISHPYLKEIEAETRPFDQVPGEYDMTAPPKTEPRVLQHVLVAPAEAARIINNFLSPGLWGQPVYNLYRRVVDPLRRLGVSFSTFHLRFTMNNSLATGTGQALSKVMGDLFSGDVKGATKAVKSGAVNLTGSPFFKELRAGKGLTEAFYKGTDDPLLQGTLRRFIDAGGTLPSPESMLPMAREVGKSMWQSLVELGRVHPFRAVGELAEASSKPIMTYAVPFAKLGAFPVLDRALQDRLETKYAKMGPETPELAAQREAEYHQGLFDINKHLDNIYGQMNYDSLLLNRKIKDLLFFVIKFPGWNIGSGRWLAGKISGLRKIATGQEVSEYERASLKSGLGFMVNMAIYNTLAYWFINGRPPEDIAELFSKGVWTGGYTRSGNKEYIRDASYWRDIWGMLPVGQHGGFEPGKPIETIKVKAADIWRVPVEVFDNKEAYSGHQILTPGEPSKWAEEGLKYLGKQATPYSFRGMAQATSPWGRFGSFIGWTPTPARLTDTPAMQEMRSHRQAEAPTMITTQKQGQREVKRDIMDFVYEGDGEGFLAALRQARAEGQITSSQYKGMVRDGHEILRDPHYGPLRASFRKLNDLSVAIKVYGLATPEEREALGNLMQQKWGNAQADTRRQHRKEFMELKARIAAEQ